MWPGSRHQAAAYFQKASGPCSFSTASDASWAHAAVFFRWTDIGIPGYLKIGKCHKKMIENHGQITEKWFKLMEHYSKWFKTKTVQKAWDLGVAYFQTSLIGKQSTNQPSSTRHCQSVMHVAALCVPWLHHRVEDEVYLRHLLVNETTKEFLSNPGQITIFH